MHKNNKILNFEKLKLFHKKYFNKKIIHCHGVFDVLHFGHINYLNEAKKNGDILIVSLTSDKYVNKGFNRPYFSQEIRAHSLASLECVNYVYVNNNKTAEKIIKIIKPNFYVKGPDYINKKDINLEKEKKAIQEAGGKIIFTKGISYSSSKIINDQLNNYNKGQLKFLKELKNTISPKNIDDYFRKFSNTNILIIGEIIIDEYIFCDAIGKSGKEPVMVNKTLYSEKYAGGVLTVSNHLSSICKSIKILSYIGDKDNDLKFINKCLNKNTSLDYIKKNNSPTIKKTRLVDNYTKNKITGLYNINDIELNKEEENKFIKKLNNLIKKFDQVIVVDYGHGLLTKKIISLIEKKSKFLSVNAQINSLNNNYNSILKYSKANYVCLHEGELRYAFRERYKKIEDVIQLLKDKIKSKTITITKGKEGSLSLSNNKFFYCPAFANEVVDRIGAGDTLLSYTSICQLYNVPNNLSLLIGNIAAANFINKIGTGHKINKIDLINSIKHLLK